MWFILFIFVIGLLYFFYNIYLKDYVEVKRVFDLLEKTLSTRDLLVMKLLPEIKDKKKKAQISKVIDDRMKNKNIPYNEKIKLDVELNKLLKEFYPLINEKLDNPIVKATFKSAIELEKSLKKMRNEYNIAVEKYNMNLVIHKFVCIRLIHMKPLDTYTTSSEFRIDNLNK